MRIFLYLLHNTISSNNHYHWGKKKNARVHVNVQQKLSCTKYMLTTAKYPKCIQINREMPTVTIGGLISRTEKAQ